MTLIKEKLAFVNGMPELKRKPDSVTIDQAVDQYMVNLNQPETRSPVLLSPAAVERPEIQIFDGTSSEEGDGA